MRSKRCLSPPDVDVLVLVSHEGETPLTLEAHAFAGAKWLVTGKSDGPIVSLCDEVVVATSEVEERPHGVLQALWPRSLRCAARTSHGYRAPSRHASPASASPSRSTGGSGQGAGRDWPTAQRPR